jgi:hypothetical protein
MNDICVSVDLHLTPLQMFKHTQKLSRFSLLIGYGVSLPTIHTSNNHNEMAQPLELLFTKVGLTTEREVDLIVTVALNDVLRCNASLISKVLKVFVRTVELGLSES